MDGTYVSLEDPFVLAGDLPTWKIQSSLWHVVLKRSIVFPYSFKFFCVFLFYISPFHNTPLMTTRYESTWSIATNHRHASDEGARLFYEAFEKYDL